MVQKRLKKINTILFFCFLVITGMYFGAALLIPFTFGVFFSTLVVPISNFLESKAGAGRITSSFISTIILFIGIGLLIFFLFRQLGIFANDLVGRQEEIRDYVLLLQEEFMATTGFSVEQQKELLANKVGEILRFVQNFLTNILAGIGGVLINFMLILIYVFLFLVNRNKLENFVMSYVPVEKNEKALRILGESKKVAHKYLWGRIQVMILLGILYSITFFSYGLAHAPLLIIFGVIITIIPYIGPLLSGVLPVLFMIVFGGSTAEVVSFTAIVLAIQLFESYVAEPLIIGSEVQQSPLFVIIAVLLGGAIWGIAGMILFVPIFAILKIMFDSNKELEPAGFLIGYDRPGSGEGFLEKIKKKFK